jgi:hypothetical protein
MQCRRGWRQVLCIVICGMGSIGTSAVVFAHSTGQPPEKKAVNKPRVTVKTHNIEATAVKALNARPAVLQADRKPWTLDECSKLAGKTWTPDTQVPIGKKTVAAKDILASLNQIEISLNNYGYSLHDPLPPGAAKVPKGGVQLALSQIVEPKLLAKQREAIVAAHKKATAANDKIAKTAADKYSKANSASELKAAKATEAQYEKSKKALIAALKKVNTKKLAADEKKVYDHVEGLLNPRTPVVAKAQTHAAFAAKIQNEAKETASLVAKTKFTDMELYHLLNNYFANAITYDKDLPWAWSFGSASTLEVNINGDLQLHGALASSGSALSAKGSLKIAGFALSQPFTALDVEASASSISSSSSTSLQLQLSAKLFGSDIFSPINDSATIASDSKSINQDFPYELTFLQGDFVIVVVPVRYTLGIKGDINITSHDLVSGALLSSVSSLTASGSVFGEIAVDLVALQAGASGTVNLVSENLQLVAAVGFGSNSKVSTIDIQPPHLGIDFSVHDQLSVLSGELDGVITTQLPIFGNVTLYSVKIFSFPGFSVVDGYLPGTPIHIAVPAPPGALPGDN